MDAINREKWKVLDPEGQIIVTIEYKEQEIADELYRLLQLQIPETGFLESRLIGNQITVKCARWSNVTNLEGMARAAKMNVYEKKFEKSQKN